MKIIDFEKKGNVVRFYLGEDDCEDYGGDDWNDTPYEHNAGRVYDEYVSGFRDVFFPFDWAVCEPCEGNLNSSWCKDDMKEKKVPCIAALPKPDWLDITFNDILPNRETIKLYFGDSVSRLDDLVEMGCTSKMLYLKMKGPKK